MQITVGYKILLLLLLSHECGTWSFILKEDHGLRVNEKMVLSKIFVHGIEEVSKSRESCVRNRIVT